MANGKNPGFIYPDLNRIVEAEFPYYLQQSSNAYIFMPFTEFL